MMSDRHDPDATPELQDEFWGEQTEWMPQATPSRERHGVGSTIGRWWDGLLGGRTEDARRVHGEAGAGSRHDDALDAPVPARAPEFEPDAAEDGWEFEPEPQPIRGAGVDPLIARLGGLAVILTLAAPLVVGFTGSGSDSDDSLSTAIASAPAAAQVDTAGPESTQGDTSSASTEPATPASTAGAASDSSTTVQAEQAEQPSSTATASVSAESASLEASATQSDEAATTATTPTTAAACGNRYELASGDYWIRIADAADVSLADLLDVNDASVDTVLVPGRSICLPVGASTPAPPPTVATTAPSSRTNTTTAPSNNTQSTRAPATTAAPAPTTTTPARPAAVPESAAAAIIREVWPDELEERALQIAWRESNHQSNVNNFCCYGLFQIYYSVHRSWLATIGVNSAQDLFDPRANAIAAYTLYQRAGGWGPWGG